MKKILWKQTEKKLFLMTEILEFSVCLVSQLHNLKFKQFIGFNFVAAVASKNLISLQIFLCKPRFSKF